MEAITPPKLLVIGGKVGGDACMGLRSYTLALLPQAPALLPLPTSVLAMPPESTFAGLSCRVQPMSFDKLPLATLLHAGFVALARSGEVLLTTAAGVLPLLLAQRASTGEARVAADAGGCPGRMGELMPTGLLLTVCGGAGEVERVAAITRSLDSGVREIPPLLPGAKVLLPASRPAGHAAFPALGGALVPPPAEKEGGGPAGAALGTPVVPTGGAGAALEDVEVGRWIGA